MECKCGEAKWRVPRKRWHPLGDGSFRLSLNGSVWLLTPTPGRKYPWLLHGEDGTEREIGMKNPAAAQAMAEFDIEVSRYLGGGDEHGQA